MAVLLFFLGLLIPFAVVGGVEGTFYVIDSIKYHKAVRLVKAQGKLDDAKKVAEANKKTQPEITTTETKEPENQIEEIKGEN